MNSDSPNTADIVERLEGPVPVFNKNGQASIDLGENYRERKEAAAIIQRYEAALRLRIWNECKAKGMRDDDAYKLIETELAKVRQ